MFWSCCACVRVYSSSACMGSLSEVCMLFTGGLKRPIISVSDRLTLITTFLFLLSDWMSPFDRVVCGEYHLIVIIVVISLKHFG